MSGLSNTRLKVMVSSSVYGFEEQIDQIHSILTTFGYDVWSSHKGSFFIDPRQTAFENCLRAVAECDVFLGIIRSRYGSGKHGDELSITHQEVLAAIKLDKFRIFAAHHDVVIARQLLKQFRHAPDGTLEPHSSFEPNSIIDDIRVIEMYEAAARLDSSSPFDQRTGNWVQEYMTTSDLLSFITTQLQDPEQIRRVI